MQPHHMCVSIKDFSWDEEQVCRNLCDIKVGNGAQNTSTLNDAHLLGIRIDEPKHGIQKNRMIIRVKKASVLAYIASLKLE